ncbi:MAG TPA: hypothetical protein VMW30_01590 [Candidatus Paceibacterota bacterium]|nr:hypothetical protein [Candidatus Paceibacterota bacterium]
MDDSPIASVTPWKQRYWRRARPFYPVYSGDHFNLVAYDAFLGGTMIDREFFDASIQATLETVPRI